MNRQPDQKEIKKKNGQKPEEEEKLSTAAGEQMTEFDLPEVTVAAGRKSVEENGMQARPEAEGRVPHGAMSSGLDLRTVFGRKAPGEVSAAREQALNKSRNATEFFRLMGWWAKGGLQNPVPNRGEVRKKHGAVPARSFRDTAVENETEKVKFPVDEASNKQRAGVPELKAPLTGVKPSGGGASRVNPVEGERVEKEALKKAFAGKTEQKKQEEEKPGSEGLSSSGGTRLDKLYAEVDGQFYRKGFDSFVRDLDTPVKRRDFYNALVNDGRDAGDYADFEAGLSGDLEKILGKENVRSYRDEPIKSLYAMTGGRPQGFSGFRERMNDPENWAVFYNEVVERGLDVGEYDDFVAWLSGIGKEQAKPKDLKPKDFWDEFGGDFLERAGAGLSDLNGAIYSTADLADRVVARPFLDLIDPTIRRPFREFADQQYAQADELRRKSDRYRGKTLKEQFKEGDYGGMLGNIVLNTGEALPGAALAAASGGYAPAVLGAAAAVKKYDDLNRMPETQDLPEYQKMLNAVTTGTVESLAGKLGGKMASKQLRELYKNAEKKVVRQDVAKRTGDWLEREFRKYGVLTPPVVGALEEAAAQIGENIADYTTGVTDEWDPMRGAFESLVYGAGEGVMLKAIPGRVKQEVTTRRNRPSAKTESAASDRVPGTNENGRLPLRQLPKEQNTVRLEDGRKVIVNSLEAEGRSAGELPLSPVVTVDTPGQMMYDGKVVAVNLDNLRHDRMVEIRDGSGRSRLVGMKDLKPLPQEVADGKFTGNEGQNASRKDAAALLEEIQNEIDLLSRGHSKNGQMRKQLAPRIRELKQMKQEIGGLLKSSGLPERSVAR